VDIDNGNFRAWFESKVRESLAHLYDPAKLRSSPLVDLLGLAHKPHSSMALQDILSQAVAACEPSPGTPDQANAWRLYNLLSQRYVEQFSIEDVAANLNVGLRQLRRLHNQALQMLSDHLWAQYDLTSRQHEYSGMAGHSDAPANQGETIAARHRELEWVQESIQTERVDAVQELLSALSVVRPLMDTLHVHAECELLNNPPTLAVRLPAVRQALLGVLYTAIHLAEGGAIRVRMSHRANQLLMHIWPVPPGSKGLALALGENEALETARELLQLSGGDLRLNALAGDPLLQAFELSLPLGEQIPILVIDDNADTLRLIERYLSDSPYLFTGTREPKQGLALASRSSPRVIILDLMLPDMDGWEVLSRLRQHPDTCDIPILVSTILPYEDMALLRGAAAFMRKPLNRSALLEILGDLVDQAGRR
jgi:CheY-like chemotaxis protein